MRSQQPFRHLDGALGPNDAGEQQLSGIRAAHVARLLRAIERQRIGLELRAPERRLECFPKPHRLRFERGGLVEIAQSPRAFGGEVFGRVDVALDLGERNRSFRQPAVGVEDGVIRIFPALVGEALLGRAVILDEAVAVGISRAVDPRQRGFDRRPQFA